jgi:hypothetical protein
MITVIDGLTGSGKTWLMSRLLLRRRKKGDQIFANLSLKFPDNNEGVTRWYSLSETYSLTHGVIAIDEGQKLFDAHLWPFLPMTFAEKIASHRHEFLDIYTTTQDFGHIDVRVRENVHDRYTCQSFFRFPKNERYDPIIQIVRTIHKSRSFDDVAGVKWTRGAARWHFISRFWTRSLYDTHANINLSHFVCQIKRDKKKWMITLQSRQLMGQRRS